MVLIMNVLWTTRTTDEYDQYDQYDQYGHPDFNMHNIHPTLFYMKKNKKYLIKTEICLIISGSGSS